jgi:hypothetical protein
MVEVGENLEGAVPRLSGAARVVERQVTFAEVFQRGRLLVALAGFAEHADGTLVAPDRLGVLVEAGVCASQGVPTRGLAQPVAELMQ